MQNSNACLNISVYNNSGLDKLNTLDVVVNTCDVRVKIEVQVVVRVQSEGVRRFVYSICAKCGCIMQERSVRRLESFRLTFKRRMRKRQSYNGDETIPPHIGNSKFCETIRFKFLQTNRKIRRISCRFGRLFKKLGLWWWNLECVRWFFRKYIYS